MLKEKSLKVPDRGERYHSCMETSPLSPQKWDSWKRSIDAMVVP